MTAQYSFILIPKRNISLANPDFKFFFLGSGAFGEVFEGQISGFITNSSGNQSSSQDQGLGSESKGLSMYFFSKKFPDFIKNKFEYNQDKIISWIKSR